MAACTAAIARKLSACDQLCVVQYGRAVSMARSRRFLMKKPETTIALDTVRTRWHTEQELGSQEHGSDLRAPKGFLLVRREMLRSIAANAAYQKAGRTVDQLVPVTQFLSIRTCILLIKLLNKDFLIIPGRRAAGPLASLKVHSACKNNRTQPWRYILTPKLAAYTDFPAKQTTVPNRDDVSSPSTRLRGPNGDHSTNTLKLRFPDFRCRAAWRRRPPHRCSCPPREPSPSG